MTAVSALAAMEHVLAPVQPPDQPVKAEPAEGVAVKVTVVPRGKAWLQVEPQERPVGLEMTVPEPLPVRATLTVTLADTTVMSWAAELAGWFQFPR